MESTEAYNESLIVKYLCGEMDKVEKKDFEIELLSNKELKQHFDELKFVWEQSQLPSFNTERDWQKIRTRMGFATSKISMLGYFVRIAAALVLILTVSAGLWVYWNVPGYGRWVVFETGSSSDSIVLPDASIVFLNRNSSLKYPNVFPADKRSVELKGEGYFEVNRDVERPFQVEVGDVHVQVLGTAFRLNENRANGVVELNVTQGIVRVKNRRDELTVQKGEWALANKNVLGKGLNADSNFISWKTGMLEFNSATLREIAIALNHHYPEIKSVEIDDVGKILVTTKFEHAELSNVLEELSMHFEKKFILNNGKLVITD